MLEPNYYNHIELTSMHYSSDQLITQVMLRISHTGPWECLHQQMVDLNSLAAQ